MDTMLMKPAEEEEINIQYMTNGYTTTIGWCPMVWLPALLSICSLPLQYTLMYSLQSSNYCVHYNVASGWVAYGILEQYHWLSLVTWEMERLSVLQVTTTCRAKVTCVIWDSQNCAAENCELSGLWHSVIRYVGLDISRTLQCFNSSDNTRFASWHNISEELLLQTWLGPMPHVMLMWYRVLSDFSIPW